MTRSNGMSELTQEQKNGKEFTSYVQFLKELAKEAKKQEKCNNIIYYTSAANDVTPERQFELEKEGSLLISTMAGKVCIFKVSVPIPDKGMNDGDAIFLYNPNIQGGKLKVREDGVVWLYKDEAI